MRGTAAADRLCLLCVELLDVDAAAISLVFDGANHATPGASSVAARHRAEVQFALGEGPCLSSVADRAPVFVPDLTAHGPSRWPTYAPAMVELGIAGVVAVPVMVAGEYVGALDLFRHRRGSLTPDEVHGALAAASLAEVPLLDLLGVSWQEIIVDPASSTWHELLASTRIQIGRATRMLGRELGVDPAEALVRLRAHAYATLCSPTEVAREILDHRLRLEP